MQLQLSLAVADKLHETLLVRGEPLDVLEAACLLTASSGCPLPLGEEIVRLLVAEDRRFCWTEPLAGSLRAQAASDLEEIGPEPDGGDDAAGGNGHGNGDGAPGGNGCERRVSLSRWHGHDFDLADVPFVALDLETTGARAGTGKITEIGAVRIEGFREVACFNTLVNPLRPIPAMITAITGISHDMVANAPRIEEVIPQLLEFLRGAVVVAHNASFDVGFLNYELRRLKGRELGEGAIDTLPLARALAPGLPNYKLGTVAEALGSPVAACHRALADAQAAGHVFVTLMGRLREQGVTRLSDARRYMAPSSRPATEKLALTREVPGSPGTYLFVDADDRIIYVGKADRLRDEVRSYFVGAPSSVRKVRQAVRLVERVDWEETLTSLEAAVREQELILRHRPSCNQPCGRPESYVYLKVRDAGPGLCLYVSNREPKTLPSRRHSERKDTSALALGPFRGRARLNAALDLLQRCYPIRRCPRQLEARPCVRGESKQCLAPCEGTEAVLGEHDGLVGDILAWLTGQPEGRALDPVERAQDVARELMRERRFEEAQQVRDAMEDLLGIRRSYATLTDACRLRFALLSPLPTNGEGPALRLNLVWNGRLVTSVSLLHQDAEEKVAEALGTCRRYRHESRPPAQPRRSSIPHPTAVWQGEVDQLLAIRRWYKEAERPGTVLVTAPGPDHGSFDVWKDQLVAEALRLLGRETAEKIPAI